MRPRYDLVLLDADETLFDFPRSEAEAIRETLAHFGLPHGPETVRAYHRINAELWAAFDRGALERGVLETARFARLLARLGAEAPGPEELNRAYEARLGTLPYLLPGAEKLCRRLYPACRLVIVTNGHTAVQTGRLERSAIRPYIQRMFVSQALGCRKPEPAFFRRVFQALELGREELARTVLVGDRLGSDILGGIRAGLDTVWLNPAGAAAPPELAGQITRVAATLEEVGDFILGETRLSQK